MDAKKIVLLVAALLVAGVTAFFAKQMFAAESAPAVQAAPIPVKEEGPEILVATRTLPIGTIIGPDSFRYQPWPSDLIENAYFEKGEADPAGLAGTVVRAPVTAGQPLTKGALVQPGDRGFLAAALGPGMRAVTVSIDKAAAGVAGFIFPGDRVDLVLTQTIAQNNSDSPLPLYVSGTIVRNVRVLATDQKVVAEDQDGKREIKPSATVTLEVTPRIAEKVAVADAVGELSLALRSIADNTAELERAIAAGTVKVPANTDPKAEKSFLVQVASRPIDTDPTFVVGGDVSRFQRTAGGGNRSSGRSSSATPRSYDRSSAAPSAAAFEKPVPTGPVVRVARGNNVTEVTLGGK